ncbi:hypothetical protein C8R43DRAFT_1135887 [Mycena crocata]|nr:hypothetical protein C8R43DRAFT_1135887 [Mycena crocata]
MVVVTASAGRSLLRAGAVASEALGGSCVPVSVGPRVPVCPVSVFAAAAFSRGVAKPPNRPAQPKPPTHTKDPSHISVSELSLELCIRNGYFPALPAHLI